MASAATVTASTAPASPRHDSDPAAAVEDDTASFRTVPKPAAPVAAQPMAAKRSRKKLLLGTLALVVLIGGGTYLWLGRGIESTDDAQVDADIVAVPARTGGTVARVLFVENQRVEKGVLLAELDSAPAEARLSQAEATLVASQAASVAADAQADLSAGNAEGTLAMARASLQNTHAGALGTEESIREGEAAVENSRAKLAESETNLTRARALIDSGAYSRAQFDQTQTAHQVAVTDLAQAEAKLASLRLSRNAAESRVVEAAAKVKQSDQVTATVNEAHARADQAHAQVALAQAQRELAALDLSYTKIYAPTSGIVSRKSINVGQSVASGQTVVQLVPDTRWVTANFKETQLGEMRVGQPVSLTVDAYPGVEIHGQIESLAAATGARFSLLPPDNATGNFTKVVQRIPVRVKVLQSEAVQQLVPGMSADVHIDTRAASSPHDAHGSTAPTRANGSS